MTSIEELKNDPCTIMLMKTVNFGNIRSIANVLRNTTQDSGLRFDEKGIHLISIDSVTTTINMELYREKFEEYMIKYPIEFSIYPEYFYKALRSFRPDSMITLYIQLDEDEDEDTWRNLYILNQQNENDYGTTQTLPVNDIENRNNEIISHPSYDIRVIANCSSAQGSTIQDIIKNQGLTDTTFVEFEYVGGFFIISSEGQLFTSKTTLKKGQTISDIQHNSHENKPISGKFDLSALNSAFKSSEMSNKVHIEMRDAYPLLLRFSAGLLGEISFSIYPKEEEEENDD